MNKSNFLDNISNYFDKVHKRLYKLKYYSSHAHYKFLPHKMLQKNIEDILSEYRKLPNETKQNIDKRVNYYNKLNSKQIISKEHEDIGFVGNFNTKRHSAYFFDLAQYLPYFEKDLAFSYIFGDVAHIPSQASIVKSRPISDNNQNSVLLKLDSVRHFYTVNDSLKFEDKIDKMVWRGASHQKHRIEFLQKFHNHPLCDVKCVHKKSIQEAYYGKFMSIKQQLKHKFVFSIEGFDVATNTKWIMASNSLCVMIKPKIETWLMEGLLQPDVHYVHLSDDYSDLDEKLSFYIKNPQAAQNIINNANNWMKQFSDKKQELIISLLVLQKYFDNVEI